MKRLVFLLSAALLSSAQWIRVDSPGLELLTDEGEQAGRQLTARFEQVRSIFRNAGIADGPSRLRVFAFASAAEFHRYRPDSDGFYTPGADRDYIALHSGAESDRVACHEYVHLVLAHSSIPLPKWFDEGTAEFYSTVEFEKDHLRIGGVIPSHLARLAGAKWLDAASLERGAEGEGRMMFYAESWALVHMLNLAPAWRDGMPQFLLLLSQGKAPEEAFREAFNRTPDKALADLPAYLRSAHPARIPAALDHAGEPSVKRLTREEAAIARAELALNLRNPEFAAAIMNGAGDSPASEATRGAIALAENRRDEARRHLDRAIALGSRDASLYFEYAMLERENGRPDFPMLRKVLEIDPDFADAAFLMGIRETDDGDWKSAISHLRTATRIRPQKSGSWQALSYAQAKAGDFDGSAQSARRAIATAETDAERQAAQALLGLGSAERPLAKAPVTTPESWRGRKGDARAAGTLINFDCGGDHPRVHLREESGATVVFEILHPAEIELINAPQPTLQISCGPQNWRVTVEYESGSRDVTRIEFPL